MTRPLFRPRHRRLTAAAVLSTTALIPATSFAATVNVPVGATVALNDSTIDGSSTNAGTLELDQRLATVTAGSTLDNSGAVVMQSVSTTLSRALLVDGTITNTATGSIGPSAAGDDFGLFIRNAGRVDSAGTIQTESVTVSGSGTLNNSGTVSDTTAVTARDSATLNNSGSIALGASTTATPQIRFEDSATVTNSGQMSAGAQGNIFVSDAVTFTNTGQIQNTEDMTTTGTTVTVNTGSIALSDRLSVQGDASLLNGVTGTITADDVRFSGFSMDNAAGGSITSRTLSVSSGSTATNSGAIVTTERFSMTGTLLQNKAGGTITSGGSSFTVSSDSDLVNDSGATITITGTVGLNVSNDAALLNAGLLTSIGRINGTRNAVIENTGTMETGDELRLFGNAVFDNSGTLTTGAGVRVDDTAQFVHNGGNSAQQTFVVSDNGTLQTDAAFDYTGQVSLSNAASLNNTSTLNLNADLALADTTHLTSSGTLNNSGTLSISSRSSQDLSALENSGTFTNTGTLVMTGSATMANDGLFQNAGTVQGGRIVAGASGKIVNTGQMTDTQVFSDADVENDGSMSLGRLEVNSTGQVINRGQMEFATSGRLEADGGVINTQGAVITASGTVGLRGSQGLTNDGTVFLNGRLLTNRVTNTLANSGTIEIGTRGSMDARSSDFLNSAGSSVTLEGFVNLDAFRFEQAMLDATGQAGTNTQLSLTGSDLSFGTSANDFRVFRGDMTLSAMSTASFKIGGTARGTGYDFLNVTDGTFDIDASSVISVSFLNGFLAAAGDTFDLIRADDILPSLADLTFDFSGTLGTQWDVSFFAFGNGDETLRLTARAAATPAVPLPAGGWLLLAGLLGLGALRKRATT